MRNRMDDMAMRGYAASAWHDMSRYMRRDLVDKGGREGGSEGRGL